MANPWEETYAPATTGDPESFKKEYLPAAQRAGKELNVDPDIILGQWGNETGWGKSIVPGTNNLGNIKLGSKGGEGVEATDNTTKSKDKYRKYKSTDDFADDYVKLIKGNYPKAVGAGNDPAKFTAGLKGYAEDKSYPAKVKAASETSAKAPTAPWQQTYEAAPQAAKPEAKATPESAPTKDPNYVKGAPEKATFGESLRDVGQAGLSLASGLIGGAAGLAAEVGTQVVPGLSEPKPYGPGIDPYKVKEKVQNALTYEPKTAGAKALTAPVSAVGEFVDKPREALVNAVPDEYKSTADIAYNLALPHAQRALGEAVRTPLMGGEASRLKAQENVKAFRRAGVETPTLGQVSEGGYTKNAGAPKKLIEKQQAQLEASAEKLADKTSQVKNPEEAGKIIREAISGTPETKSVVTRKGANPQVFETGKKIGGYIDNARQTEEALYNDMYKKVGRDTKFAYPKLFSALDDMTRQNPNLMATSGGMINRGILDLRERLVDDTSKAPKQLGYEDARWLRSKIGELTDPRQIVPGDTSRVQITPAQADALYAAMSEDMMAGVSKKGPRAEAATLKANQFTRNLHQEISNHLQPVMNSKLLKDAYDNATSGTRDGNERLAATWKTLDPFQKDAVKSVFFRELGRKGDAWDMKQFTDNYSKMHETAKDTMFGAAGKSKYRNDLDNLAKVANKLNVDENTWHKLKSFLLTGGTLGTVAATGAVAGFLPHAAIGTLLAGPGLGFITGNLIRNPKFVDWFTKTASKTKPSSIPFLLSNLQSREKDMSNDDRQEVEDYVNKVHDQMTPDNQVQQGKVKPQAGTDMDPNTWGKRADGSQKGSGFLGVQRRPDGGVSTEISAGVEIDGKEVEIPTMVPTLTKKQLSTLLSLGPKDKIPDDIMNKATAFAKKRIKEGKSPFAQPGEGPQ